MKLAFVNAPWYDESKPELWGVRAGSRWPHFQRRQGPGLLPRYVPFPFFLAIAAAAAQAKGHEVMLLDGVAENLTVERSLKRLRRFKPALIFMEVSTPSLSHDLAVAERYAALHPKPTLVFCGAHAFPRPGAVPEAWIRGEYDLSPALLAEAVVGRGRLTEVPGLLFPGAKIDNPPAKITDVNALPSPLFDQLPMDSYSDPVCGLPSPSAQSWTSRGCPFNCSFCVWPQIVYGDRRFRPRSLDAALDEVELLINKHGCESFYFDDDTTNVGESRMVELAAKIKARGLSRYPWSMMARADCMTPKALEALAGAGMFSVKYGVESVSPKLLDACDKGTQLDKLKAALALTRQLGVRFHLTFTFGIPGETPETIAETTDFALATAPDTAQFSLCTPFPGTRFFDECKAKGYLVTDDWSRYLGSDEAVVGTPELPAAALKAGLLEAERRWAEFNRQRLERRQTALLEAVGKEAAAGRRWTFLGDRDFAAFLWDVPELAAAHVEAPAHVLVIASRHDEEKLYRRALRSGTLSPLTLKLYEQ